MNSRRTRVKLHDENSEFNITSEPILTRIPWHTCSIKEAFATQGCFLSFRHVNSPLVTKAVTRQGQGSKFPHHQSFSFFILGLYHKMNSSISVLLCLIFLNTIAVALHPVVEQHAKINSSLRTKGNRNYKNYRGGDGDDDDDNKRGRMHNDQFCRMEPVMRCKLGTNYL